MRVQPLAAEQVEVVVIQSGEADPGHPLPGPRSEGPRTVSSGSESPSLSSTRYSVVASGVEPSVSPAIDTSSPTRLAACSLRLVRRRISGVRLMDSEPELQAANLAVSGVPTIVRAIGAAFPDLASRLAASPGLR